MSGDAVWHPNSNSHADLDSWSSTSVPLATSVSSISIRAFIAGECDGLTVLGRHGISLPISIFKGGKLKSLSVNCCGDEFLTRDLIEGLKGDTSLATLKVVSPCIYLVDDLAEVLKTHPSIAMLLLGASCGTTGEGALLAGVMGSIVASNPVITTVSVPLIHWGFINGDSASSGPSELIDTLVKSTTVKTAIFSYGYLGTWAIDSVSGFMSRERDDPLDHTLLVRLISEATSIEELSIVNMCLKEDELRRIIHAVAKNTSIKSLDMSNCYTCTTNMESVGHAVGNTIEKNKTLLELSLTDVKIGKKGLAYIADSLSMNSTLKSLTLDRTVDSDDPGYTGDDIEVGEAFGNALKTGSLGPEGSGLEVLDLGYNPIGSISVDLLVSGLAENTRLKYLNIDMCTNATTGRRNIGVAIGDALATNSTLNHLAMCGIPIDKEGAEHIGEGLRMNTVLRHLHAVGTCRDAHLEYEVTGALENWNHTLIGAWMDVGIDYHELRHYITRNHTEMQARLETTPVT